MAHHSIGGGPIVPQPGAGAPGYIIEEMSPFTNYRTGRTPHRKCMRGLPPPAIERARLAPPFIWLVGPP